MQKFNILANLCSWAGWLKHYQIGNHEDRFYQDKDHIIGT